MSKGALLKSCRRGKAKAKPDGKSAVRKALEKHKSRTAFTFGQSLTVPTRKRQRRDQVMVSLALAGGAPSSLAPAGWANRLLSGTTPERLARIRAIIQSPWGVPLLENKSLAVTEALSCKDCLVPDLHIKYGNGKIGILIKKYLLKGIRFLHAAELGFDGEGITMTLCASVHETAVRRPVC